MNVSGLVYNNNVIIYNDFCKSNQCAYYIELIKNEWIPIYRCKLDTRDNYDVVSVPSNCPYHAKSLIYKEKWLKEEMWEKLSG